MYLTSGDTLPGFAHDDLLQDRLAVVEAAISKVQPSDAPVEGAAVRTAAAPRSLLVSTTDNAVGLSVKLEGPWSTSVGTKSLLSGLNGRIPLKVSVTVGLSWLAYTVLDHEFVGGDVLTTTSGLLTREEAGGLRSSQQPGWFSRLTRTKSELCRLQPNRVSSSAAEGLAVQSRGEVGRVEHKTIRIV